MKKIEIYPVTGLPIIKEGDNLTSLILQAAEKQGTPIQNGDVIVVTHVVVSRAEGNVVNLETITPSQHAKSVAKKTGKDPRLAEVILRESKRIVRMRNGKLITETKQGLVCANSGVDCSYFLDLSSVEDELCLVTDDSINAVGPIDHVDAGAADDRREGGIRDNRVVAAGA